MIVTAAMIAAIVREMDDAANQAVSWMAPGGVCCAPPTRLHGYCTNPGCIVHRERTARQWAIEAGHAARRLQRLAEIANQHPDGAWS